MGKGEAHAQAQSYEAGVLLQTRLYPDMLPLLRQVQIATDTAKNAAARLAGVDALRSKTTRPASRSCTIAGPRH